MMDRIRRRWPVAAVGAAWLGAFLLAAPGEALAREAAGGLAAWIATYDLGGGALTLNPVIIAIQWINFLVLLIVLNRILLKPLGGLMEARGAKIRGDLASAERDRREAQGYISQYEDSLAEIQRENTEAVLALQQEMTEATRARLDEVRETTGREIEQARQAVAAEARRAREELGARARDLAAGIARRLAGRPIAS